MINSSIQTAREGNIVFLKIFGKGHFILSQPLKDFCMSLENEEDFQLYLDMKNCTTMDSTFMGVLANIAINFQKKTKNTLNILNLSEHNYRLLNTLGIDIFLNLEVDSIQHPAVFNTLEHITDKEKLKKDMLEAHETLIQLNESNKAEFQDVCEYLKTEIDKTK